MGSESLLVLLALAALLIWLAWRPATRGRQRIEVEGEWRTYSIHRPKGAAAESPAVLMCFHGGLGNVDRLRRRTGILEAGLQRGFTMVFPEAPQGWIDARPERGTSRRDLAFIETLVGRLRRTEGQATRFFVLGVSNGGMFAFRLAMEQPQHFTAFATLLASIPAAAMRGQPLGPPAPITLVFGRSDRIMPWPGGHIASRPGLGVGGMVISAEATLEYWLKRNRSERHPLVHRTGGGPVEIRDYPALPGGAPVRFVSIEGWRHEWPRWADDGSGGFDIADVILEFFAGLPSGESAHEAKPVRIRLGGGR